MDELLLMGIFYHLELLSSINTEETLAIQYSYMSFKENLQNSYVYLLSNNTTTISYIKSIAGVTFELCSNIVEDLWNTAVQYNIWFKITYLTRKLNTERYIASCFLNDRTKWEVSPSMFCCITDHHEVAPSINLFASCLNWKLLILQFWT